MPIEVILEALGVERLVALLGVGVVQSVAQLLQLRVVVLVVEGLLRLFSFVGRVKLCHGTLLFTIFNFKSNYFYTQYLFIK